MNVNWADVHIHASIPMVNLFVIVTKGFFQNMDIVLRTHPIQIFLIFYTVIKIGFLNSISIAITVSFYFKANSRQWERSRYQILIFQLRKI